MTQHDPQAIENKAIFSMSVTLYLRWYGSELGQGGLGECKDVFHKNLEHSQLAQYYLVSWYAA